MFFKFLFIYWLCWVFVAVSRLPLVEVSGGLLSSCHVILIVVASLIAEHRL